MCVYIYMIPVLTEYIILSPGRSYIHLQSSFFSYHKQKFTVIRKYSIQLDNMASRQSIDSTYSTSPLIQGPASQPHPEDHASHGKAVGENTGTKVRVSTVIAIFRLLALISGVAIGTSFALLGAWRVQTIVLIVLTWISVAWNGLMLASLARKPSLRISLVFRDGDIIQFGSQSEGNRGKKCRCRYPRAFWVDLFLVSAVIALNVAQGLLGDWYYWDYYHTTVSLNWFTM